jgi:hypothetical protein
MFMSRSLAWAAVLGFGGVASAQFVNPGFEDPITFDGPPFVGFWEGFSGGATAIVSNSTLMPRSGAQHASLAITNTDNTFAGVFQDVPVTAGEFWTFSGYHKTPSSPLDVGVEFRIEWRNSVSNTEIGRTPNSTTAPSADYTLFSLGAAVPAGADLARVVYAIQTFTPEPTNNGTVFLDDMSFVVPEPTSAALLACGAGLVAARRRRA